LASAAKQIEADPAAVRISCRVADWLRKSELVSLEPFFEERGGVKVLVLSALTPDERRSVLTDQSASPEEADALLREAEDAVSQIVTRKRRLSSGKIIGGIPFTKGPLAHLLKNRMYLGEINHGQQSYPGEHSAIVDRDLFEAVQGRLASQVHRNGIRSEALLIEKLLDDRGHRMTPSFAVKRGVRYRYYVSRATTEGRRGEGGTIARVPAPDVERAVLGALVNLVPNDVADGIPVAADCNSSRAGCANTGSSRDRDRDGPPHERGGGRNDAEDLRVIDEMVESVTVDQSGLAIMLNPGAVAVDRSCRLLVPWSKPPNRVRHELLPPADGPRDDPRVIGAETRILLLSSEPVSGSRRVASARNGFLALETLPPNSPLEELSLGETAGLSPFSSQAIDK